MSKSLKIAIILPDTLQRVGLRSLLTDYFSPVEISLFTSYNAFLPSEKDFFDFYFILPDIFVVHPDFFLQKQTKTICIIHGESWGHKYIENTRPGLTVLRSNLSQEEIVEKLRTIFQETDRFSSTSNNSKELSEREKDVLRLIVKGLINKEIADKLYISLNTVLTHRKNITSKLGIKTIPGLTFYAITHGLIPGNEIEL